MFKLVPFLILITSLFFIVYIRKNLILTLIFIELCFLAINLILVFNFLLFNDIKSQVLIIYIFTLTAIETALGLALFILYYKMFNSLEAKNFYSIQL
jgi:NADH:ubiquinone oxidoreductase subunit K